MADQILNMMYKYTGLTAVKDDDSDNPTYTLWDEDFTRPVARNLKKIDIEGFVRGFVTAKEIFDKPVKSPVEICGKNKRCLFRVDGMYGYEDQFIWADGSDEALKIARTICPKYNGTQIVFNPKDMDYGDWLNKVNDISAK